MATEKAPGDLWKAAALNAHAVRYVRLLVGQMERSSTDRDVSYLRKMRSNWRVPDVDFRGVPEDVMSATQMDISAACSQGQAGDWDLTQRTLDRIKERW